MQAAYSDLGGSHLPIAQSIASQVLSIPIYPELRRSDAARVVELINKLRQSFGI